MTCIVAIVEDGKVTIGGDSAASTGYQVTVRNDTKVFQNGDFLFGSCGSARMCDLLHYALEVPTQPDDMDTSKFMRTVFIDALRECFSNKGYTQKFSEQEYGGTFLVGYKGKIYGVYNDFQVGDFIDGYAAVGCGDEIALGVLYATHNDPVEYRIKTALEAATYHCNGVRPPFTILSMQTETVVKSLVEALA